MGVRKYDVPKDFFANPSAAGHQLPAQMLSDAEWTSILHYYKDTAPEKLEVDFPKDVETLSQFRALPFKLPIRSSPSTTLIHVDTVNERLHIGNRMGRLYTLDFQLKLLDSLQMNSTPVHGAADGETLSLVLIGIMDPNDEKLGQLVEVSKGVNPKIVIDSLRRPVHFAFCDLNDDGLRDVVISSFGNNLGDLTAWEMTPAGTYVPHPLAHIPGARRVEVRDLNNDGKHDIVALMAQGDEQIAYFENDGEFTFEKHVLLRFPPSYGTSYFEMHDFNNDGHLDLLIANGDNADYSPVTKPYHGVRIFYNDGRNGFSQHWFYAMPGATQAVARDFDNDGDLDIAAIAFFADFANSPEGGFVYFENTTGGFKARYTKASTSGRWMVMETADLNRDGRLDIILGSMPFAPFVPKPLHEAWGAEGVSLLVLYNTGTPSVKSQETQKIQ